jgi:flagellar hook protein FlgE
MALTSTLFTGLSGMDVNQARLNVVGNNIANMNTVAFKRSRALFKPQFYVTDSGGSPPSDDFGGTNPSQRGLGAVVAAIEKDFSPGALEPTGRATDMAIDGDGFFVVQGPDDQRYTRDGTFSLNASNQLVTASGEFVQGFGVDADGNVAPGRLGNVTIPLGTTTTAQATGNALMEGNLNANGPAASGASILTSQVLTTVGGLAQPTAATLLTDLASATAPAAPLVAAGDVFTLQGQKDGRTLPAATFTTTAASTVQDLLNFYRDGLGIDTTVPDDGNPATPLPGTAIEADATNPVGARLVVTGNLGAPNALSLAGTAFVNQSGASPFTFADGANAAGIVSNPAGEGIHTSFVAYDSLGTPLSVDVTAVLESKSDAGNTWRFYAASGDDTDVALSLGNGTLTFDSDGKLITSTGTALNIDRANTGAATPLPVNLDFSSMTSLTSRSSEMLMTVQDGSAIGTLNAFSIGADGTITGSFSNGLSRTLGQVAMATFSNPTGLVDKGGNQFVAGANSGVPVISAPLTLGAGSIRAGALELSNVDLSEEFINLIISSTGFSASSRVITTSDQLITELLNSSR